MPVRQLRDSNAVRSLGANPEPITERFDFIVGERIAGGDCGPAEFDLANCLRVGEDGNRLFDRFEIIGADENGDRATVSGHSYTLMGGNDFVDNLGKLGLHFG